MLVALLSICAEPESGGEIPRGLLNFAGQSIAERQIELAVRMGADRVVCLVDTIDAEVIDLQDAARDLGVKFNAVSGARSLLGQVAAGDELLLFGDGVLPAGAAVEKHLGERSGVLVIPAEGAVEEGYERIDGEWAWAGVLRASGASIEALSQLPVDIDPVSALLRIALQRGTRVVPIDGAKAMRAGWLLARDETQLAAQETEFLRRFAKHSGLAQPTRSLADVIAFRFAGRALDRQATGLPASIIGAVCAVGSVAAASEGMPVLGLGLLAFGSFARDIGRSLSDMLAAIRQKGSQKQWVATAFSLVFDVSLVALSVLAADGGPRIEMGVLALMLIGLLHLSEQVSQSRLLAPLKDRTLVYIVLAIGAGIGLLKPAMAGLCLAIIGLLLLVQRQARLTPA